MQTLEAEGVRATLDPLGARLASLTVRGHELLAPDTGVRLQSGCYPMVPWAGRLDKGRFDFEGVGYQMAINMEHHAIHGLGTDIEWEVTTPGQMSLDLSELWPLGGSAAVGYELTASSLTCTLTMEATDMPLPCSCRLAPMFRPRSGGSCRRSGLRARPHVGAWRRWHPDREQDARQERGLGMTALVTSRDPPRLAWGSVITVSIGAPTATWVVFDMLDDVICVEPLTDVPNAFNMSRGKRLEPGDSLALPLEIRW